ncbi:MAG: formylmethanofuran dehydrogenase subunit E family protein [Desulfosporosinus sp.]|nr:formylmethanofuran dehydrogenase subunit E family protein [Desulfosporosinus sp.]
MCVEKTPWEQVIDFHGHTCPEISIGYRVAQIATRELGIRPAPSSELVVTAYTHSCALDAFQVLNRATYGRGNLRVEEKQQHVYHFQYTGTSEGLQISIQAELLDHLVKDHDQMTTREKQNSYLEAIQYILGTEETLFCTIQKL